MLLTGDKDKKFFRYFRHIYKPGSDFIKETTVQ